MSLLNWNYLLNEKFTPKKRVMQINEKEAPQLSLSDVEQAYVGDKKSKEYISLIDNLRLIIRQKK